MALVTVGIFSITTHGITGSIFLMIAHGITSSALFICVGLLYDRHHTRIIRYYSGLLQTMPLFSVLFFLFSLANLGLPLTSNFVGELLVLIGCYKTNTCCALISGFGMVLSAAYSLWLCNRILFGNIKCKFISFFVDLTKIEFACLLPFALLTILFGIMPSIIINLIKPIGL